MLSPFTPKRKKKKKKITSVSEVIEKLEPCALRVGIKMAQLLRKTVWKFLTKLEMELPYDPAIPLLGIYIKEMKAVTPRDIHSIICKSQRQKQPPVH